MTPRDSGGPASSQSPAQGPAEPASQETLLNEQMAGEVNKQEGQEHPP